MLGRCRDVEQLLNLLRLSDLSACKGPPASNPTTPRSENWAAVQELINQVTTIGM